MSPEAQQHYAQNPYELLAAEGFNQDPTLAYMNYYNGPVRLASQARAPPMFLST
jgi:hypothetical protein